MRRRVGYLLLCLISLTSLWASEVISASVGPRVRRSCQLGWDPPTTNSDASPLTDLAGFRIYVSTTQGSYGAYTLQVSAGTTTATCRQLGLYGHNQTYYVRITAIDGEETPNESTVSNELALTVTMGGVIFR